MSAIERLEHADKDIKTRFNAEFENMQQYLKDQNIKFSQIVTQFRQIERKVEVIEKTKGSLVQAQPLEK